jgi:hypothetical protein
MTTYAVSSAPIQGNPDNPMVTVGIYGQVGGVYVLINVFKSALDQAFANAGQAGIESYLSPLMLAASTALYLQAGDSENLTMHSNTPIPGPAGNQYPNMPSSWTA